MHTVQMFLRTPLLEVSCAHVHAVASQRLQTRMKGPRVFNIWYIVTDL